MPWVRNQNKNPDTNKGKDWIHEQPQCLFWISSLLQLPCYKIPNSYVPFLYFFNTPGIFLGMKNNKRFVIVGGFKNQTRREGLWQFLSSGTNSAKSGVFHGSQKQRWSWFALVLGDKHQPLFNTWTTNGTNKEMWKSHLKPPSCEFLEHISLFGSSPKRALQTVNYRAAE